MVCIMLLLKAFGSVPKTNFMLPTLLHDIVNALRFRRLEVSTLGRHLFHFINCHLEKAKRKAAAAQGATHRMPWRAIFE